MKKKSILLIVLVIIMLLAIPITANAGSSQYSYSFNIHAATSGTNWHPYRQGSCTSTSSGKVYDYAGGTYVPNPSPAQKYEVFLVRVLNYSFGLHAADGIKRTKSLSVPSTADYYPKVTKYTSGAYTLKGSGYTRQTW